MAESSLDQVAATQPIEIVWRAFELRPDGQPPMDPAYAAMIEQRWPGVQEMGRNYGVEMRTHRFGINTRPAHEGAKFIQAHAPDQGRDYHHAVFRAYFYDDRDIGQVDVLAKIAGSLPGVDHEAFRAALEAGTHRDEVLVEEDYARRAGISGVPAYVINDKYLVSGVRPPEQLRDVFRQIAQEG